MNLSESWDVWTLRVARFFGTTEEFLRCFGVQGLEELPSVDPVRLEDFKAEAEEEIQLKLDI